MFDGDEADEADEAQVHVPPSQSRRVTFKGRDHIKAAARRASAAAASSRRTSSCRRNNSCWEKQGTDEPLPFRGQERC